MDLNWEVSRLYKKPPLFVMLLLVLAVAVLSQGEILATNDSSCVLNEINARLGIAAQIIETARQKFPTDLKELCHENFNCTECKNRTHYVKPIDCSDIYMDGERRDGLYDIWPQSRIFSGPLRVYCDMESDGGGWTVLQRRGDFKSPLDYFFRRWNDYKRGFGDMLKDFWIGNDNMFALTNQKLYHLRVNLTDWEGVSGYAVYDEFWISDELQNYTLHVNGYRGTAGDSMGYSDGQKFSTKDRENSPWTDGICAEHDKGAWWYKECSLANLNGLYHRGNTTRNEGVGWKTFKGYAYSFKNSVMKIRPAGFTSSG